MNAGNTASTPIFLNNAGLTLNATFPNPANIVLNQTNVANQFLTITPQQLYFTNGTTNFPSYSYAGMNAKIYQYESYIEDPGTFYPSLSSGSTSNYYTPSTFSDFSYKPSTKTLTTNISGRATNIAGGTGGSIPYQSSVNTTAFLANGTSGQYLKSNGTTLAPSWATFPVITGATGATGATGPQGIPTTITAGTNIGVDNTTPTAPVVSLLNPLTSQLNIGSQDLVGGNTSGTQSTFNTITNASGTQAFTQMGYDETDPALEIHNRVNITADVSESNCGTLCNHTAGNALIANTMSSSTTGSRLLTSVQFPISTGVTTSITRTQDTALTNIVDTQIFLDSVATINNSRQTAITAGGMTDAQNFNNGSVSNNLSTILNGGASQFTQTYNGSGFVSNSVLSSQFGIQRHDMSCVVGGTQSTNINNQADGTRSRSEVRLQDGTILQRNRVDANGLSCSYEQFSQNVLGANKTTTLTTNATSGGAFLATDGTLNISSLGTMTISTIGSSGTGNINITPKVGASCVFSTQLTLPTTPVVATFATNTLTCNFNNLSTGIFNVVLSDNVNTLAFSGGLTGGQYVIYATASGITRLINTSVGTGIYKINFTSAVSVLTTSVALLTVTFDGANYLIACFAYN